MKRPPTRLPRGCPRGRRTAVTDWLAMTDLRLLEREMYAEAEAARPLDVAASTLHSWLDG